METGTTTKTDKKVSAARRSIKKHTAKKPTAKSAAARTNARKKSGYPIKQRKRRPRSKAMRKKQLRIRITLAVSAAAMLLLLCLRFLPVAKGTAVGLSDAVLQYREQVEAACAAYEIPAFSEVALAIMQQESAGSVPDVMQSSESPYNTQYPNMPNAITDPAYSIQVGIETLAACLEEAGCTSPRQRESLKLALQTYNYGNSYATWALEHYDGYSAENAAVFSENMKARLGWSAYGDTKYVEHVLRYYRFGF